MAGVLLITLGFILLLVKCLWFRQPLPFIDEEGSPEQANPKIQMQQGAERPMVKAPERGDYKNAKGETLMATCMKATNGKDQKKIKKNIQSP